MSEDEKLKHNFTTFPFSTQIRHFSEMKQHVYLRPTLDTIVSS
jgi:hypothetical protein